MSKNYKNDGKSSIMDNHTCGIQRPTLNKHFAVINPSKICQPMGAVQALLGIKGAMPLIHGSQGCSTYMRFQLCRHFREPVNVSSSSMSEATVVYGGEANLIKALETVWKEYEPELIGVTSSCLTETIGDDMNLIINKFRQNHPEEELPFIVPVSTPSYTGSHVNGYDMAIKSLLDNLAYPDDLNPDETSKDKIEKINIVPGNLPPADIMEIKEILEIMTCKTIILTDNSESLDAPLSDSVSFIPREGTTIEEIRDSANSKATISLSKHADSGGKLLEKRFGIKSFSGPLPVGLNNTDGFLSTLCAINDIEVPKKLIKERGRLIDALVDAHSYTYQRKVAIYGDPDVVTSLARFTCEMGMIPSIVCTGSESDRFTTDMELISQEYSFSPLVMEGCDLYDLQQQIKSLKVDMLFGNSYGARIAKEENIPHFRMGFPIYDRMGAQRISMVGYRSGIRMVDTITNMILEKYYDDSGWEV